MNDTLSLHRKKLLTSAKRIVVKVGSGVLTGEKYDDVSEEILAKIAGQVAALIADGKKVSVVSSGSVAIGSKILSVARHGLSIPVQQAAAAVGQGNLISLWSKHLTNHGQSGGQILLTHDDLTNRRRFINSRNTVNTLLEFGVTPIINENDTVAVHEIKFGDNDTLSARVTNVMEADLLAILSDVDGLFTADPRLDKNAKIIPYVERVTDDIEALAGDSSSKTGLGGMSSKVKAAAEAARFGAATIIVSGAKENSLVDAVKGADGGTFFFPREDRLSSKKHWIEFTLPARGRVTVDEGAKNALLHHGKSLLALGVKEIEGNFESGEAVNIAGVADNKIFAKGLSNYHSHELVKIKGTHSNQIEKVLGYKMYDEVVHRDDLVLLDN